jgi:hypothetical protein
MFCHHCGGEIKIEHGHVGRTEECARCGSDLHCCLNCTNYDPGAHNRCREPQAEWVSDREKANFCDLFIANSASTAGQKRGAATDPRSAFDNLFKK